MLFHSRLRRALSLLDQYGSAESAWAAVDEPEKAAVMARAEKEWEWVQAHDIRVLTQDDEAYPYRLRNCPDRPFLLYTKGHVCPSEGHIVSIVGTRRPTERGKELTAALVRGLADRLEHVTIVSGGAYGIDIAAHRAALEAGIPTIIVPAHGLDRIYPVTHRPEAVASLTKGGLLTEYPSGTEPIQSNFVRRNRIVAGLADAVVVVESHARGGSLITARMANDYGKPIFAFPGRPNDPASEGCNDLIRGGRARLITGADHLIEAMEWKTRKSASEGMQTSLIGLMDNLTKEQQIILAKLQEAEEGMHINLIVMETGLAYGEVASELTMLEIEGFVRALPGGVYIKI